MPPHLLAPDTVRGMRQQQPLVLELPPLQA